MLSAVETSSRKAHYMWNAAFRLDPSRIAQGDGRYYIIYNVKMAGMRFAGSAKPAFNFSLHYSFSRTG